MPDTRVLDSVVWSQHIPKLKMECIGTFPKNPDDLILFIQRGDRTTYQGPEKSYILRWEGRWVDLKAKRVYLCLYVPDRLLEEIWANLKTWTQQVKKYGAYAVMGVSFSPWLDDPLPVQLYNLWRIRFMERYLQDNGVRVIPSLIWGHYGLTRLAIESLPPVLPSASLDMQITVRSPLHIRLAFQTHAVEMADKLRIDSLLFWGVKSRKHKLTCLRYGVAQRHLFMSWGYDYREILAQKRERVLPMVPLQRKI